MMGAHQPWQEQRQRTCLANVPGNAKGLGRFGEEHDWLVVWNILYFSIYWE